jgi:hypothetical protein
VRKFDPAIATASQSDRDLDQHLATARVRIALSPSLTCLKRVTFFSIHAGQLEGDGWNTMATGMDKLLDHLQTEIALRGVQGKHDSLRVFVVGLECTPTTIPTT